MRRFAVAAGLLLGAAMLLLGVEPDETDAPPPAAGQRSLDVRQFLAEVNLRDFSNMVANEAGLIGGSVRLALQSSGPRVLPLALVPALFRGILLVLVMIVFGSAIVAITAVRGAARMVQALRRA